MEEFSMCQLCCIHFDSSYICEGLHIVSHKKFQKYTSLEFSMHSSISALLNQLWFPIFLTLRKLSERYLKKECNIFLNKIYL